MTRQRIAEFLQGLCVLPLSALFGGLVALLFRWPPIGQGLCIGFFVLFPLIGALRTGQRALLIGLLAGLAITALGYFALRPTS